MNKIAGFNKAGNMVKLDEIEGGEKEVWFSLTPKIQQFIGRYKIGQEVEYESNEKDGKRVISFMKIKGTVIVSKTSTDQKVTEQKIDVDTKPKCEDCGCGLKDDSYKTCYTCSMVRRKKEETSPEGVDKQKSIRSQAIGNMVSRSLIALQGSFDINNIGTLIDTLYEHYERNIKRLEQ